VLRVFEGSLYPALVRVVRGGWLEWGWGWCVNNRQAKFYKLTKKGERQLREEQQQWERMTLAVRKILEAQA
jgi:DNA-binding PadR family transcriptional regulator